MRGEGVKVHETIYLTRPRLDFLTKIDPLVFKGFLL